jgi:hypothetical protein
MGLTANRRADSIKTIRAWPSVEEAWLPPEISLPKAR